MRMMRLLRRAVEPGSQFHCFGCGALYGDASDIRSKPVTKDCQWLPVQTLTHSWGEEKREAVCCPDCVAKYDRGEKLPSQVVPTWKR